MHLLIAETEINRQVFQRVRLITTFIITACYNINDI
jgi:hypothetical protein